MGHGVELNGKSRQRRNNRFERVARYMDVSVPTEPAASQVPVQKKASFHRPVRLFFDVPLLLVVSTLILFGLIMVYSASWEFSLAESNSPTTIFEKQLMWLALGFVIMIFLAWLDYRFWQKLALPVMAVTVALLVTVLVVNDVRLNAARSLIAGSIRPSELAKLATVLYLAVWLHAKRDQLNEMSFGLIPMVVILGILGGLVFLQPDLSAVGTIVLLGGMLFFLAGGDVKQISLLVVGVVIIGAFVVTVSPTGKERVGSFLIGLRDLTKASDHVQRSIEALARGGWFGVGIGKGVAKLISLPVPHTDSIFAVVGEETGWIGTSLLVVLYGLLLWRGLVIARRAHDGLGVLLASGLTFWIVFEALVNMSVMVGLMPFAGNALPFISAGGSSLVVTMAAVGILFNISRKSEQNKELEERFVSEVVDLRRRYWRRSVPRSFRSPGSDQR
jgi:cell division protein FtsW